MIKHDLIWAALDKIAEEKGLSPSGLARLAQLDPTTFNRSKRNTVAGKPRWPSTESIAKVLSAANVTFREFSELMDGNAAGRVPVIGFAQAGNRGFFDDAGYPVGGAWEDITFPALHDPTAYGLRISGDSMSPVFRDGDLIIVSPASNIRPRDRVVVKTREGEVMAKELVRRGAMGIELKSLNPDYEDRYIEAQNLDWIARILWCSQ
ncbi:helix-turn-helix transcriptional regulator [Thalassospira sp. TSL5-1]|uniref:S24 family peptidase n=1 Tax=Thalassospira sp. TSL5-1 TaxID=1544451 RepID=UPI00093E4006|nr:helix-turn-helix transcriptional regulator [Thalassospira sp. TSL5-1]OKH89122.1 DNA-binding protein [Thalassospira sp. TSL5-1]